jgi:hypothetical protein
MKSSREQSYDAPKKEANSIEVSPRLCRGTHCSLDETIIITLPCKFLADGMGMRWNGVEGHFFDKAGNLIALDPSVRSLSPGALLMRRESLIEFLDANDLQIIWTFLGEKQWISGGMAQRTYKGRLEISGAYRFVQETIQGAKSCSFVGPGVAANRSSQKR